MPNICYAWHRNGELTGRESYSDNSNRIYTEERYAKSALRSARAVRNKEEIEIVPYMPIPVVKELLELRKKEEMCDLLDTEMDDEDYVRLLHILTEYQLV